MNRGHRPYIVTTKRQWKHFWRVFQGVREWSRAFCWYFLCLAWGTPPEVSLDSPQTGAVENEQTSTTVFVSSSFFWHVLPLTTKACWNISIHQENLPSLQRVIWLSSFRRCLMTHADITSLITDGQQTGAKYWQNKVYVNWIKVLALNWTKTQFQWKQYSYWSNKRLKTSGYHFKTWSHHVDDIVSKMGRGVSIVSRISNDMPSDVIRQLLNSSVLPQLYYC